MHKIADLLFQASILKHLPRSGYHFLGAGQESVAEHCFSTTFIAFVMTHLEAGLNGWRLVSMCLVHDLLEARTGDLNTVHKSYVTANHALALEDTVRDQVCGQSLAELIEEFETGESREAQLARDADQIAFIIDLKKLSDVCYRPPRKWLPPIMKRIKTDLGQKLARSIMDTDSDRWWIKNTVDTSDGSH